MLDDGRDRKNQGMDLLVKSALAAPKDADIRMHLAKAMLKAGNREGAAKELRELVQMGDGTVKLEAEQLLKTL